jgi:hypothetical protein
VLKPQREGGGHNIYKEDIRFDESHLENVLEILLSLLLNYKGNM